MDFPDTTPDTCPRCCGTGHDEQSPRGRGTAYDCPLCNHGWVTRDRAARYLNARDVVETIAGAYAETIAELRSSLQSERLARETAEQDTARLDWMESITDDVSQEFLSPGNHGGQLDHWLLTHERQEKPYVTEWEGKTLRDVIDLARAAPHPETRHE